MTKGKFPVSRSHRKKIMMAIGTPFTRSLRVLCKSSKPSLAPHSQARNNSNLVKCDFLNGDYKVAVLTLNDPDRLNALTEPMGDQLGDRVRDLKQESGLRVAILRGEGRAFSAGGDLNWLLDRHRDSPENNQRIMVAFYKRFLVLRSLHVPVIGVINGAAVGAGMCLALGGCDLRIAHTKAKMGVTFTKLGLHPGMAATHFLPRIVGPARAAELLLTGRLISAAEALEYGVVSEVSDDPMANALNLAESICSSAPEAVRTCIQTLRQGQEHPPTLEESMNRESSAQAVTYPTEDLYEGVKALQEKRSPVFTGK